MWPIHRAGWAGIATRGTVIRSLLLLWRILRYAFLFALLLVFFSHALVLQAAADRIVLSPHDLPRDSVVLLLGTSRYTRSGRPNEFFLHRIQAAADALESGRVTLIVASGDGSGPGYNEPRSMLDALKEKGVSPDRIVLDAGGLRTLDSVDRMQAVLGYDRFVIISQRFHLERALFLATHRGIDATGLAARDATGFLNLHIRLREYLARVQAVFDVYVLRSGTFLRDQTSAIEFSSSFTVDCTHEKGA